MARKVNKTTAKRIVFRMKTYSRSHGTEHEKGSRYRNKVASSLRAVRKLPTFSGLPLYKGRRNKRGRPLGALG